MTVVIAGIVFVGIVAGGLWAAIHDWAALQDRTAELDAGVGAACFTAGIALWIVYFSARYVPGMDVVATLFSLYGLYRFSKFANPARRAHSVPVSAQRRRRTERPLGGTTRTRS